MENKLVEVAIRGVMPTTNGCAIFLGCPDKTFVIYVDQSIGNAISMVINNVKKDRPLTHDLLSNIFVGVGIVVDRVVINDVNDGTFFARLYLTMENELGKKIIEIDARPSDSIVLALQAQKPIYTNMKVLGDVDDMSEILERILKQQD